jgi:hypothetical protein
VGAPEDANAEAQKAAQLAGRALNVGPAAGIVAERARRPLRRRISMAATTLRHDARMQGRPGFHLYHSNALDVLAGLLAAEVARVPADGDWLRPDVVLVPQFSMRRWLQQALAEQLGICANLRFLTPGEFVKEALDANLGKAGEGDELPPEVLRWHLLRELRQRPPEALAAYLNEAGLRDADPRKAWYFS